MAKKLFTITGMHCNSCAILIEKEFKGKVNSISVDYAKEKAEIDFDESKISEKEIIDSIEKLGYVCSCENKCEKTAKDSENKTGWIVAIISILFLVGIVYFLVKPYIPDIQIPQLGDKTGLLLLFLAGIVTGFHCIAMCGGFVVSYTAKNAINGHKSFNQHLVYGGGKLLSYTIIGGIFGLIGGVFAFSVGLRGWVAILAGAFMIAYALGMMGIKSFKMFQFKGKMLTEAAMKVQQDAKGFYKAPFITGLLNGLFIACGPLQAMYLYAAGTGNVFSGASALFAFGLGTLPIMLGFGFLATTISHKTTAKILKISAVIVLILGLIMLNRGLTLTDSPYSLDKIKSRFTGIQAPSAGIVDGYQVINMDVDASGFKPNSFVLKKGVPVKWKINVKQLTGCNNEIIAKEYGMDIKLKQGLQTVEFTPDKTGNFGFSCWMGMLRGSFIVTETGVASQQQVQQATPKSSSCSMGANGRGCGCGG